MVTKEQEVGLAVRLESIHITGYRSCRNTSFSPNAELSALIGINGAGKTNILQAIRLLDASRAARRSARINEPQIAAGTTQVTAWFRVGDQRIGLKLILSPVESGRRTSGEMIAIDESWNLAPFTKSKAWRNVPPLMYLQEVYGGVSDKDVFLYSESEFMLTKRRHGRIDFSILENPAAVQAIVAVTEFRAGISYYSASQFTDPSRCPSSFEVDEEGRLAEGFGPGTGMAHLKFLHNLYSLRQENPQLYEEYCRFVSRQQLGLVSRITWKEIELSSSTAEVRSSGNVRKIKKRKTLVIPKVQIGTSHITFNQLSEGTFKTLALAFYIITDASQFLMVEEPEVCVHHGLLRKVISTIKTHSHRKQTIISTHSDLLVDELDPSNLFVVEMSSTGTQVNPLEGWLGVEGREALHTYLAESGPLGEYWRSGGLT